MEKEINKQEDSASNKEAAKGCLKMTGIYVGSAIIIIVLVKLLLDYLMK